MIIQHKITFCPENRIFNFSMAYSLYAWLLSCIPRKAGDVLHGQSLHPINQYVLQNGERIQWIINLLTDEAIALFNPVLETENAAIFYHQRLAFCQHKREYIESEQVFIERARRLSSGNRFVFDFLTPTSFKQNGQYVLFPQESLMMQSLIRRWDLCFPDQSLNILMPLTGIHIADYRLSSARYTLKQTKIPSFQGRVILENHLTAEQSESFKTLYVFAPYVGMGIKTSLGMGGVNSAG
jgi:hypothetical protein